MSGRLHDRFALVTGAGRGFGAAIALALANEGANVAVHYNSSRDGAEAVAASVRALGRQSFTVQGDISRWDDVKRLTADVFSQFGKLDVLVNNVGDMASDQMSWRDIREEAIDHMLAVDVKGTMFMIHEVGSRMIEQQTGGSIVNIGSRVVAAGSPRAPHYAAAKYGVIGLTKSYALALAPRVRVNALGPGFMETDALLNREDWKSGRREKVLEQMPLKHVPTPEEVAPAVVFLASDDSRNITGGFLISDGGISMVGA
ncbi:MAG: 3-oxoacyl-[acyl-carrier-protein] reductase [Candidatus Dormibacteraceae bacterium]